MTSDCFTAKNIQLEDNTSEDITELVKEMWIRLNSTETESFSTLENDQKNSGIFLMNTGGFHATV